MTDIPNFYAVKPYDSTGQRKNTVLPLDSPHTLALVAPRNCGKSTVLIHLLLNVYRQRFHRIVIFNPTFYADEKWCDLLRVKHVLAKSKYFEEKDEEDTIKLPLPTVSRPKRKKTFDGRIPAEDVITDLFEERLKDIIHEKQALGDKSERWLLICDDLAASGILRQDRTFLWAILNGRHAACSIWVTSQTYSALSRGVRLNMEVWFLFTAVSNKKELLKMYEEHSCGLDQDEWLEIYKTVKRGGQYAFLSINYTVRDTRYCMTNSLKKFIGVR